jgi:hypothetical protein
VGFKSLSAAHIHNPTPAGVSEEGHPLIGAEEMGIMNPKVPRMLPKNELYYGREEPLAEQVALRAGPLSLVYEEGDLRYIKLGDREILRRLYAAVRDRNWGTVPPVRSNIHMEVAHDWFRILYDAENCQGEIDFFWKGTLTGDAQGTITFSMEGEARSTFMRNRIGFCVLHPIRECPGKPCRVEKADGTVEEGTFPKYISPHQPFKDMRAISHEVVPGVWAEVRFTGDIFEMEDQRNWTDASYKTYCTPLTLPFPVQVKQGTRISQSVTLTLTGAPPISDRGPRTAELVPIDPQSAIRDPQSLTFTLDTGPAVPLPRLGLGVASHGQPLSQTELVRLRALNLSHLRVDLRLASPHYAPEFRRAHAEASALGVPLEVALFLSDAAEEELEALTSVLEQVRPAVCTWLFFHTREKSTSERWIRLARERLAGYDPKALIGSGTNVYFTELNRGRPPAAALDLVCYSINPQVHAFDNASLVESLEAQASTVESARQIIGDRPLAITPITLKPRFNPDATGPEPEPAPGELPWPVDLRQMSLFGAGWTLGSLKYLGESGVFSTTYYETTGWRGVMETEAGSPLPERFRSLPGSVYPLYHVLADVAEFAGGEIIPTRSSDTLQVDGLALRKEGRTRAIVANLSPEPRQLTVHGLAEQVRVRQLNETNAEEAMRSPEAFRSCPGHGEQTVAGELKVQLLPFAIACIDAEDSKK